MTISRDEVVEIHAKALRACRGARWARRRATAEAFRCANGDLEGYDVWLQVRNALNRMANTACRTVH